MWYKQKQHPKSDPHFFCLPLFLINLLVSQRLVMGRYMRSTNKDRTKLISNKLNRGKHYFIDHYWSETKNLFFTCFADQSLKMLVQILLSLSESSETLTSQTLQISLLQDDGQMHKHKCSYCLAVSFLLIKMLFMPLMGRTEEKARKVVRGRDRNRMRKWHRMDSKLNLRRKIIIKINK